MSTSCGTRPLRNISTKRLLPPCWNDTDVEWEERPRNIEEQVEMRRARKRLEDCELPEGFRLVTLRPRQFWMGHQVRWGFLLAWARVDGQGRRGLDEYRHVTRYEAGIPDEVQMRWALYDFTRELTDAGVSLTDVSKHLPMPTVERGFKAVILPKSVRAESHLRFVC